MWTVIDQLSREEFNRSPNIAAHRSLAVDGNRVFRWVAEFNEGTVKHEDFIAANAAAESYILNYQLATDEMESFEEEDEFESEDEFFEEEDDF